jgi:putative membrane protein
MAINTVLLGWHVPAAYDFALRHEAWHLVEHLSFLVTSILFWWCILQPWRSAVHRGNWGHPHLFDLGRCG